MKKYFILLITFLLTSFQSVAQIPAPATEPKPASFAPLIEKLLPTVVTISSHRNQSEDNIARTGITSDNPNLRDYFLNDEEGHVSQGAGFLIDTKGNIVYE